MKTHPLPTRPTALALLLAATALPFSPAFAQDAPTVIPTVAAPPAAPAPTAQAPTFAPAAPVVQATPPRPEIDAAVAAAAAERPRAAATRAAAPRASAARTAAPRAVAPVTTQAAIPEGETIAEASSVPEDIIPVPAQPKADVAAPTTEPVTANVETTSGGDNTNWLPIVGGLLVAGAIAAFLLSRRRRRGENEVYHAPIDVEGAPVAEVNLNERPWIRLALQPKPAASANDQKVEYELTVENEGRVTAHDVRVSSFMLAGADSTPEEAALIDDGCNTRRIDVQPGETVRLAGSFDIRDFLDPKLIADARYALPDGGEGHLAAKFGIDVSDPDRPAHVEDVLDRV